MATKTTARNLMAIGGDVPTNGAAAQVKGTRPYAVETTIRGVAALLLHRWNVESVAEKAASAKGSASKKSDDVPSYVYRDEAGDICLPGSYLHGAVAGKGGAAKYRQDPRSPRKCAVDLCKAGIVVLTELASLGSQEWDYLDARRVVIQTSGITRMRPAFKPGWHATFSIQVLLPEYISPDMLQGLLTDAGRLVGLGDFRPTYGRFVVERFEVLD